MNRKFFIPLACLAACTLLFSACKSKKGGTGEAYVLKMRLNKGDKFGHDLDMSMKMAFSVSGHDVNMDMGIKGATSFEVDGHDNKNEGSGWHDKKYAWH